MLICFWFFHYSIDMILWENSVWQSWSIECSWEKSIAVQPLAFQWTFCSTINIWIWMKSYQKTEKPLLLYRYHNDCESFNVNR